MADNLLRAAYAGDLTRVKALVANGVDLGLIDSDGNTAVLIAAGRGNCPMVTWLLQYGGASFTETTSAGENIWDLLMRFNFWQAHDTDTVVDLLRVLILRVAPPHSLVKELMDIGHMWVTDYGPTVRVGSRLRIYIAQQWARFDANCPLPVPLKALVHGYMMDTDGLWEAGLRSEACAMPMS
jgi:hypothetical protein